jgi:predicted  nucleic acid-binding Zn-ribbon protein
MGKFLEQYLNTVGPMRKALHSSSEDFLRSMNLPSRKQVIDLAGQVVSLETRTEALEEQIEKLAEGLPPESPSKKQVSDLASQIVSLEVRLGALAQRIEELVGGTARLELLLKRAGEPQATPSA